MTNTEILTRLEELEARVKVLEGKPAMKIGKSASKRVQIESSCAEASKEPLPLMLQTMPFYKVWDEFCLHRRRLAIDGNINKRRFPWSPRAAKRILKMLNEYPERDAIEMLNTSIDKDWADVYPPSRETQGNGYRPNGAPARKPHEFEA